MNAGHSTGYRERNSTADRTLQILELFTDNRPTISPLDVAAQLGVSRSTAYRYVQSLEQAGYLESTSAGNLRLGLKVLELARVARHGFGLMDAVHPLMQQLADKFGSNVLLTRRSGARVVCVERAEAHGQFVRLSYERGTQLPINAGSSALILLTGLSPDQIREVLADQQLVRFTPNTFTDVDAIITRVTAADREGWLVSEAEVDSNALAVAVPVRNSSGVTIAGLSIVSTTSSVPAERRRRMRDALLEVSPRLARIIEVFED